MVQNYSSGFWGFAWGFLLLLLLFVCLQRQRKGAPSYNGLLLKYIQHPELDQGQSWKTGNQPWSSFWVARNQLGKALPTDSQSLNWQEVQIRSQSQEQNQCTSMAGKKGI